MGAVVEPGLAQGRWTHAVEPRTTRGATTAGTSVPHPRSRARTAQPDNVPGRGMTGKASLIRARAAELRDAWTERKPQLLATVAAAGIVKARRHLDGELLATFPIEAVTLTGPGEGRGAVHVQAMVPCDAVRHGALDHSCRRAHGGAPHAVEVLLLGVDNDGAGSELMTALLELASHARARGWPAARTHRDVTLSRRASRGVALTVAVTERLEHATGPSHVHVASHPAAASSSTSRPPTSPRWRATRTPSSRRGCPPASSVALSRARRRVPAVAHGSRLGGHAPRARRATRGVAAPGGHPFPRRGPRPGHRRSVTATTARPG